MSALFAFAGRAPNALRRLLTDDEAATAVEYAVMLALILIAIIGAIGTLGTEAGGLWGGIEGDLDTAGLGKN